MDELIKMLKLLFDAKTHFGSPNIGRNIERRYFTYVTNFLSLNQKEVTCRSIGEAWVSAAQGGKTTLPPFFYVIGRRYR